jgi:hypothetical protein
MDDVVQRAAHCRLERRAVGVRDRDQPDLRHVVVGNLEHLGGLALEVEVVCREDRAQAAGAGGQLEAP